MPNYRVYNQGNSRTNNESHHHHFSGQVHLQYGIFFDGTLNNYNNTEISMETYNRLIKPSNNFYNGYNASYHNNYSNIARMYLYCYNEYSIYIEGSGTETHNEDVLLGYT